MKPGILKRDLWPVGLLIGAVSPVLLFLILFSIDFIFYRYFNFHITDEFHLLFLLSLTANLFPIRHYLVKLKFEKTGMGILLITIVAIITYFYLYYKP